MDGSEERGHQGFYPIHRDGTITQTSLPWDYHRSHKVGSQLQANLLLGQEDFFFENPDHFCIFAMQKKQFTQFRWKVKCQWNIFSLANDPAWTLHKGPWMGDFYDCIKQYSELFPGNCEEMIEGCVTQGYVYFRCLMPALASQLQ